MAQESGSSLANNAKWFMVVSVFQKIVTFCLNQVMMMTTSPEVLGQAAIQLELLLSTLLFLSREGIRMTVLRQKLSNQSDFQAVVNLSWLPALAVSIFIIALTVARKQFLPSYDLDVVYMYSLAAFIECASEPCYNLFQNAANIKPRITAETSAVMAKSCVTVLCVAYFQLGVKGFGLAQIAYSVVYAVVLVVHLVRAPHPVSGDRMSVSSLTPRLLKVDQGETKSTGILAGWFGGSMLSVALTLTGSSLLKHVLTEADKITLTLSASHYNQGIYAVTNNYGSLVARIVFLPLEDSSRLAFANLSSEYKKQATLALQDKSYKEKNNHEEERTSFLALKETYVRLLRLVGFIGLFFAVFGIPYVPVAVQYILGRQWRGPETVDALSMYCLYLLVMGVNGISESFVQSAAPSSAFTALNLGLLMSSVGFVATAVPAVGRLGTSGIILANVISMAIRIGNNTHYTMRMFANPRMFLGSVPLSSGKEGDVGGDGVSAVQLTSISRTQMLGEFSPPAPWLVTAVSCIVVTQGSASWYTGTSRGVAVTLVHVAVGGVMALLFLGVSYAIAPEADTALITSKLSFLRRRAAASKKDV
jgi:oligosaccharide translocation protein RFT1